MIKRNNFKSATLKFLRLAVFMTGTEIFV